mmetsp:Transcript_1474/g.1903  ORF Transcript_1474/g.1903 Transcript_1474/m.1903 type:complete len:118 (-) Transcript_1474:325-678(-)
MGSSSSRLVFFGSIIGFVSAFVPDSSTWTRMKSGRTLQNAQHNIQNHNNNKNVQSMRLSKTRLFADTDSSNLGCGCPPGNCIHKNKKPCGCFGPCNHNTKGCGKDCGCTGKCLNVEW